MRSVAWAVALLSLLSITPCAHTSELITGPNSAASWTFEVTNGASATMSEDGGALRFNVTQRGAQNWHVVAYQGKKHLADGAKLILRFKAKASTNRVIGVNCQTDVSPWRIVLNEYHNINITTQWQTYSVPLAFHDVRSDPVRVPIFILGDATGTVWIKDVSVTDGMSKPYNSVQAPTTSPSLPAKLAAPPATMPASLSVQELLHNAMQVESWRFEAQDDTQATIKDEAGMLRIDIPKAGKDAWHTQFYQVPAGISVGTYTLAVSMRSSNPRKIGLVVQQHGEPYDLLIPYTHLDVGHEWKLYKIRFTLSKAYADATRVPVFQMGDSAGTVWFRALSLTRTSPNN